ncbi:REP-associated tyrosine transposase [Rufibacter hautae]|uniref:Transposase n=1 Tax=Rufibacter hautae TaxID=2595005 RepID=A0A5B6TBS9_9BACT|nr:transposase [Rufibacter hautae]KAA3437606.1 transposase [Rufibacter hautae]
MSRHYRIIDQEKLYFLSFSTVNWVDVFIRPEYKDIVVDSLNYCIQHKGLEVYAWCLMSSHVHMIIGSHGEPLEGIVRDMKKHTAKTILKAITDNPQESRKEWLLWMFERAGRNNPNNQQYQFWQQHNHPIELNSNFLLGQKLDYIHNNPVEAGFVREPQDYLYSSAIDYTGSKGLVKVKLIE